MNLNALDDAALLAAIRDIEKIGGDAMELHAELECRKRFEATWSGNWVSGPPSPVPKPPREYRHLIKLPKRLDA